MAFEYRVKWKREGQRAKHVRYAGRKFAERRLALLTSDEPWLIFGRAPDDLDCCPGHDCACGGETVMEASNWKRANLPTLEYAVIECREVGAWASVEGGR